MFDLWYNAQGKRYIMRKQTKQMVLLAILTALAVVLSLVDKTITFAAFPYLPTAKIGLANLIVLIAIFNFHFKEAFLLVVLKIILANLLLLGPMSFIIGGPASLLSFLAMFVLYYYGKNKLSPIGISVAGGFIHITVQLFITYYVYTLGEVIMIYGGILVLVSLVTSVVIGVVVKKLNQYYIQIVNEK